MKTWHELDLYTGELIQKEQETQVESEVPTGTTGWRLKAGARLDAETGKFHRKPTEDEVEIEPYTIKDPPQWMLDRMIQYGRL